MTRFAVFVWLVIFLVLPAAAASPRGMGLMDCLQPAAEALARKEGVATAALPGAAGVTKLVPRYRDRALDGFEISETSGGQELDEIARDCAMQFYKAHSEGSIPSPLPVSWEPVLADFDYAYTDAPSTKGRPHICLANYPPAAVREHRAGTAVLLFTVTAAGAVRDVMVAASSGHLDLDGASIACAKQWLYNPALLNGVPVEISWSATVAWAIDHDRGVPAPQFLGPNQNCISAHGDVVDRTRGMKSAVTVISYEITDGRATGMTTNATSGDTTLDAYAYACVRSWRFLRHSTDNITPPKGTFGALVIWKLQQATGTPAP